MPSTTITVTTQEWQLVAGGLGEAHDLRDENGVRRDATAAEVKKALIGTMRGWVQQAARTQAVKNAVVPAFDPT